MPERFRGGCAFGAGDVAGLFREVSSTDGCELARGPARCQRKDRARSVRSALCRSANARRPAGDRHLSTHAASLTRPVENVQGSAFNLRPTDPTETRARQMPGGVDLAAQADGWRFHPCVVGHMARSRVRPRRRIKPSAALNVLGTRSMSLRSRCSSEWSAVGIICRPDPRLKRTRARVARGGAICGTTCWQN